MKFFLISDNNDTAIGMRLTGIEGVVIHTAEEVEHYLKQACNDPSIAVVLITTKLVELCKNTVYDLKLHRTQPLIVEVSDPSGDGHISSSISQYVSEAVGIKI